MLFIEMIDEAGGRWEDDQALLTTEGKFICTMVDAGEVMVEVIAKEKKPLGDKFLVLRHVTCLENVISETKTYRCSKSCSVL